MSAPRSPTFEEFAAEARRTFGFLESDFGFHESPVKKKYSEPFSIRYESPTTIVIVNGIGHGSSASIELGDPAKQREEFDVTVPVWTFAAMSGKSDPVITGDQLEDLVLQAELLRTHASDVLRGDFRRFAAAEKVLSDRIAFRREEESRKRG